MGYTEMNDPRKESEFRRLFTKFQRSILIEAYFLPPRCVRMVGYSDVFIEFLRQYTSYLPTGGEAKLMLHCLYVHLRPERDTYLSNTDNYGKYVFERLSSMTSVELIELLNKCTSNKGVFNVGGHLKGQTCSQVLSHFDGLKKELRKRKTYCTAP